MGSESKTQGEVLGTCRVEIFVREGSPVFASILSQVGVEGLPYDSQFGSLTGRLRELVDVKRDEIVACERDRLGSLTDDHLVAECLRESSNLTSIACKVLRERVEGGSDSAFASLVSAVQKQDTGRDTGSFNRWLRLEELLDSLVSAHESVVADLSEQDLQNVVNIGRTSAFAFAAAQRLAQIKESASQLVSIPTMGLGDIIDAYNKGRFVEPKVRKLARQRLEKETIGDSEIAAMLLPLEPYHVKRFLRDLGVQPCGCLYSPNANCKGNRWAPDQVAQAIEHTTARLLFRAQNEFHGKLPEPLHIAMTLAGPDEYQKKYFNWLTQSGVGGVKS